MSQTLEELIEFQVDAIDALGAVEGKKVVKKTVKVIRKRKMNPKSVKKFLRALRALLGIKRTPQYVVKPKPVKTIVKQTKKLTDVGDVPGDAVPANFYRNPYEVDHLEPVPDVELKWGVIEGDYPSRYPYDEPFHNPVPDVGPGLDGLEGGIGDYPDVYPYDPATNPVKDIRPPIDGIGNLGTLLPPRPILKPWRTARQSLFRPGDIVIHRETRQIGQIRAIRGTEVLVHTRTGYYRMPIRDLAIYYGTNRTLAKNEGKTTARLTRLVGRSQYRR